MKNFLLTEETAKKVEALIKVPPYQFDARDFRVIERGKERIVSAVAKPSTSTTSGTGAVLPFTITVGATLIASPGVLAGELQAETVETTPADGTWYLEAKVVINATTGAFTSTAMDWVATPHTNTSTDRYVVIGSVDVVSGVPDPLTISQGNYGPLIAVAHGGVSNAWEVSIF
jgi:hypothetical protein